MRRMTMMLAVALAAFPAAARAQPVTSLSEPQSDFGRLRLKIGDYLFVTDPERQVEISGQLTSIDTAEIAIDGRRFVPAPGLTIERAGDTVWDGAALGFLLGGLAGVSVGAEGCLHRPMWHCFVGNGVFMGALGAWIDHKHTGRTTVFRGAPALSGRNAAAIDTRPAAPAGASAVFDFTRLRVKRGDRVAVIGSDGVQTTGIVTALEPGVFHVGAIDLSAVSPREVAVIGDPIWNGAAYGVGVAAMQTVAAGAPLQAGATLALVYGAVGAVIDACIQGRHPVYGGDADGSATSVRLMPDIGPHRRAAALVVRF